MGGSTITVADPAGRWSLEASSPRIEADSIGGPYRLKPATCRYQQQGRAPVVMEAKAAFVDKAASRVVLRGSVKVVYGTLTLEGEQIEYDLKRGEVAAGERTKLTYGEGAGRSPSAGDRRDRQ
jgi:lipopolysaccharide assembly outer membrane protein LptD (OstA)